MLKINHNIGGQKIISFFYKCINISSLVCEYYIKKIVKLHRVMKLIISSGNSSFKIHSDQLFAYAIFIKAVFFLDLLSSKSEALKVLKFIMNYLRIL